MKSQIDMKSRTACALLPVAIAITAFTVSRLVDSAIVYSICFAILVFAVPVCLVVGWEWIRAGEPPELSLSPLIPSRAERELTRNLKTRPRLSDVDFYQTFYWDTDIPIESIAILRNILTEQLDWDLAGLHPNDDLTLLDGEFDWMIFVRRIEREFAFQFTDSDLATGRMTFDFFAQGIGKSRPTTASAE